MKKPEVTSATAKQPAPVEAADPLKLPLPGDYDDYWYQGEDGEWYNEYDDELEEGFYYTKEKKLPDWCSAPKGVPRPVDYEDYWYEGEDGSWYNEYDEELYPGQYYLETDKTDSQQANNKAKEEERRKAEEARKAEERRKVEETRRRAEEEARKAKEMAEKKAKEAAREAKAAASNLMKGFGGGLFGSNLMSQPAQPARTSPMWTPQWTSSEAPVVSNTYTGKAENNTIQTL